MAFETTRTIQDLTCKDYQISNLYNLGMSTMSYSSLENHVPQNKDK